MGKIDNNSAARWVRAALQVNPYCYVGGKRPADNFASEDDYNRAVVAMCVAESIEIIAVTDHWTIDGSMSLIEAAHDSGIEALPGFEATTSEGVHVLVIFPAGTASSQINSMIGTCGGRPNKRGSGTVPFLDLFAKLKDEQALLIAPHANVGTGLFGRLTGQQLERAVTDPALFAVGISPDLPPAARQKEIENRSGPFAREHPLTIINADDICDPATLTAAGGTTWFKLSEISLSNLEMALRAPETRVRREDPQVRTGARIKQVRFDGGFLDEVCVPFSEELTTVIGGRGTGKSTIIESIRFALDVKPRGKSAQHDHDRMIENVLGAGAVVTVSVDVLSPAPDTYTIRRAVDSRPTVTDGSGKSVAFHPLDVIGDIEVFGQHELADLARDPVHVAKMLARFAGQSDEDGELVETERLLVENRDSLSRVEEDICQLEKDLEDLPRLQAQKARYDESGTAQRVKVIDDLNADAERFANARSLVSEARAAVRTLSSSGISEKLSAFEAADGVRPALETHRAVESAIAGLNSAILKAADELVSAVDVAGNAIETADTEWGTATAQLREENQAVLRALHDEGLEPGRYLEASRAVAKLELRAAERKGLEGRLDALRGERIGLLKDLGAHRERLHAASLDSVRRATAAADGDVIVQAARNRERSPFVDLIDRHIPGQRNQVRDVIADEQFDPAEFVVTVRLGVKELTKRYGISDAQARKLFDAGEPLLREFEEVTLPDAVAVKLNVGPEGGQREYRALDELSHGQKSTALLLLLLSAASTPLIIDQPEDDLDNRFIYRGIVRRLRELKGKRQLIMTTHNANIPVLGDAELLIALESDRHKGRIMDQGIGSIDSAGVRRIAEDILEGGRDAFKQRQYRYGY